jgi:small-conductance mechanosensitive channel
METRCFWALVLLASALWVSLPASAQQAPAPSSAGGPRIAVGDDAVTDTAIRDRVAALVDALPAYEGIEVEVEAGVVTLSGTVAQEADAVALENLIERVDGVVTVANQIEATTDVVLRLAPVAERIERRLVQSISLLPLLVVGLVAFLAIAALGFLVTGGRQPWQGLSPNPFIAEIVRQLVRAAFLIAGIVVALDVIGAGALLGTVLGAAGIIGLAVGFGVRDTIENFVSSVMLSLRQPFRPNDLVEVDGELGHVIRLTSRATVLLTLDGNHVRIPNAIVFKSKIRNYTRQPARRFDFDLGVDAGTDLVQALRVGVDALKSLDFVLSEPPAQAWVETVGDSSVVVQYMAWVDQTRTDYWVARGEAIRITKLALEAAGIAMPEPIYNVNVRETSAESSPAAPAKVSGPVQATAARKDTIIERKVAAEREAGDGADLLKPTAAQE